MCHVAKLASAIGDNIINHCLERAKALSMNQGTKFTFVARAYLLISSVRPASR